MSAADDVTRRPNGEPVLEGLDPELADIARRLAADAQGFVPRAAFARQLASELRSSAGAPAGPAGNARAAAPDDLGGNTPQPPLWAKVAVGILSLTLVYGLIASIFRPSTTPPAAEPTPTAAAPAGATRPVRTATGTPSSTATPTPSATPTAAARPAPAGRAAGYLEATSIATPTATRTLAPTAAATATTRRRTATATRTSPPPPTDTLRPSSTPPPTEPPTPTDRPKPSTEPSPTPPPEVRPATATPHGEPTATPTSEEPPRAGDCREACTRKSNGTYRDCVGRGGSVEDCRRQADEMRAACIRTECEPTPDP